MLLVPPVSQSPKRFDIPSSLCALPWQLCRAGRGEGAVPVWLLDWHLLFAWVLLSSFIAFPSLSENL